MSTRIECSFESGNGTFSVATYNGTSWVVEPLRQNTLAGRPTVAVLGGQRYYFFTGTDGVLGYILHEDPDVWYDSVPVPSDQGSPFSVLGSPSVAVYPDAGTVDLVFRGTDSTIAMLKSSSANPLGFLYDPRPQQAGSDVAIMPLWGAVRNGAWFYQDPSGDGSLVVGIGDSKYGAAPFLPSGSVSGAPSLVVSPDQKTVHMFYNGSGQQAGTLLYCTHDFYMPVDDPEWTGFWSESRFIPGVELSVSPAATPAAVFTGTGALWVFYRGADGFLHYVEVDGGGSADTLVKDENGDTIPLVDSPCVTVLA